VWSPINQCPYNSDHPILYVIKNEIEDDSYFHKYITNKYDARDIDWDRYGIGTICGHDNVIGVSFKNWASFGKYKSVRYGDQGDKKNLWSIRNHEKWENAKAGELATEYNRNIGSYFRQKT
jgi:hypothetical protein